MSQLELRNLLNDESIIVPPEGISFGREGGDADVQLADRNIARRQARVVRRQGAWLLETLAAPPGARLPRPQSLDEGVIFEVGETEFEVIAIGTDGGDVPVPAMRPARTRDAPAPRPANPKSAVSAPRAPKPSRPIRIANLEADGEAPGGVFTGLLKGCAYYAVNVPLMLFNPIGTVRKGIQDEPLPFLGRASLVGYSLPSMLAAVLVGGTAASLGTAFAGHFSLAPLVAMLPAGVFAVVAAVLTGLVFHRVTEWLIEKMQGASSGRSRSNCFVQMQTMVVLAALPSALAALFAFNRWSALGGAVLAVPVSMAMVYVLYRWLEHFEVLPAVLTVLKVVGVVVLLGALAGVGATAMAAVNSTSQPPLARVETPPEVETTAALVDSAPAEVVEPSQEEPLKPVAPVVVAVAPSPPSAPEPDSTPEEPKQSDEPAPTKPPERTYAAFAQKREAVEAALSRNPTLLLSNRALRALYEDYLSSLAALEKRYAKDRAAHPERQRLYELLVQADAYTQLRAQVDKMAIELELQVP